MKILLTGSSSGIGHELYKILSAEHEIIAPNRFDLNLTHINDIIKFVDSKYDILINCAGTGVGGKIDFINHDPFLSKEILETNLLGTVLLTQRVLSFNINTKIVNITSTNNNRFYPGDLVYSLSKKSLEIFTNMIKIEYPKTPVLEIKLGLTKTNFNQNRYRNDCTRYQDIYQTPCLSAEQVAKQIIAVLFENSIKNIEISL